jgi:hypothetical protein
MTQGMILMFVLGVTCGLILHTAIDALNSVGFWRPFCDAYYWAKDMCRKVYKKLLRNRRKV